MSKDLIEIRNKMQGAANLISFTSEYFSEGTDLTRKRKLLPLIKNSIPQANASMGFLRNFIPSSEFAPIVAPGKNIKTY